MAASSVAADRSSQRPKPHEAWYGTSQKQFGFALLGTALALMMFCTRTWTPKLLCHITLHLVLSLVCGAHSRKTFRAWSWHEFHGMLLFYEVLSIVLLSNMNAILPMGGLDLSMIALTFLYNCTDAFYRPSQLFTRGLAVIPGLALVDMIWCVDGCVMLNDARCLLTK
jgi:hypothetical protein